jgi:YD repeat-containing protein
VFTHKAGRELFRFENRQGGRVRPLQHFNAAIVWVAAILGIAAGAQASGDVDPWSGRLMIEEVDLFVPAGAVSLDVRRSLIPGKGGSFGSAWWLSLEKRLEREGERAIVRQGEVGVAFEPAQEPGKFRSSSGESLSIDSAGAAVRTRPDRTAEHYDASGRLVKLDLRNGNVIALRYDAQAHLLAIEGP